MNGNGFLCWIKKARGVIGIIVGLIAIGGFIITQCNKDITFRVATAQTLEVHDEKIEDIENHMKILDNNDLEQRKILIELKTYFSLIDPRRVATADSIAEVKLNSIPCDSLPVDSIPPDST